MLRVYKLKNLYCTSDSFPVIQNLWIQNLSNRAKETCLGLDLLVGTFKSFETPKYVGKQNLIKNERKTSENCTSDSFQGVQCANTYIVF